MWKIKEISYFLVLCIVGVVGYPTAESNTNDFDNCIHMTEDIQNQINSLVRKLSSYITTISAEYEDIDLRTIAFTIDKHSPNEGEKDTVVSITVNDCLEGFEQTKYNENIEENKESTRIENSRIKFEENENSYRKVDTENQNIVKSEIRQEEIEVVKRSDKFAYNKNYFENSDKLDSIEGSNNNNIPNNHREKVKDVIKEMKESEIVLKERKNKTNLTAINSEEKRYSVETVNENEEIYKRDNMFEDDDNFANYNDSDKRSDKTKQFVDSPKDDTLSAGNEINYNNTSKKENNKFDSANHSSNNSLENTKEVYLIDYKEFKKLNAVDDDKTNSCKEVLLLSDEEKNIFNEIEKVRGEKPFMVYQRFFNNFTQYWFF